MPQYKANAYLLHEGAIVKPDNELELSTEQAERLGDKVTLIKKTTRSKNPETKE